MTALAQATARQRDRALAVLLHPELDPIVDMVGWVRDDGSYEVGASDGAVRFRRAGSGKGGFTIESVTGRNPLAVQDQARLAGLAAERAVPHPARHQNSYPNACLRMNSLCRPGTLLSGGAEACAADVSS
jgi:hypothetical protein